MSQQRGSVDFPVGVCDVFGPMTPLRSRFALPLLLVACGETMTTEQPDGGTTGACNPLVGDDCFTPFPSIFFEKVDSTSATGYRVDLPADLMPKSALGVAISPDRFNQK